MSIIPKISIVPFSTYTEHKEDIVFSLLFKSFTIWMIWVVLLMGQLGLPVLTEWSW